MMKRPTVIFDSFEVVAVPFPFTDRPQTKKRPALILSDAEQFNNRIGHSIMAMITSANNTPWPLDVPILDLSAAGLPAPSVVRMKLFTLDHHLISGRLGRLSERDVAQVVSAINRALAISQGMPPSLIGY